jgi:hypothetical protein
VLDDPKVQKLEPRLFKAWVNLLCVASRNNGFIQPADAAFALRVSEKECDRIISSLVTAGLIDDDGGLSPHNWASRQYQSDTSAMRMRRHRERQRDGDVTSHVTPPDTDTDTDTEKPEAIASVKKKDSGDDRSKRGSRLPADWTPSGEDREFAESLRLDPDAIAPRFRDFWISKPGRDGCKLDWAATWRNWCRNDAGSAHRGFGRSSESSGGASSLSSAAHALLAPKVA